MIHRFLFSLLVFTITSAYADPVSIVANENAFTRVAGGDRDESENLEVRRHYTNIGNQDRLTYLRFDVSAILPQITEASDIVSATLTLHRTNTTSGIVQNLHASALLDGVNETTWTAVMGPADRPHGTGRVSDSEGITVTSPLGSLPIAANETGDLSIQLSSSDLFALLQADTNNEITLVLSAAGSNTIVRFASITNTSGLPVPTLTVDIAPPPTVLAGDYAIDGTLDIYGDDLTLGTTTVDTTDTNGVSITYQDDATNPTTTFQGTQAGQIWIWQNNGAGTPVEQMRLNANGTLTVSNTAGQSITLDPTSQNITLSGGRTVLTTDASGDAAVVGNITTSGDFLFTDGRELTVQDSNFATSWGDATVASGFGSTAWGYATEATAFHSTALGSFNIGEFDGQPFSSTTSVSTDPILEVGIGLASNVPFNAMTVLKDGRMALGPHDTMNDLLANTETVQVQGSVLVKDSVRVDTGNITATQGDIEVTQGDITVTNGKIFLSQPAGDVPMFGLSQ